MGGIIIHIAEQIQARKIVKCEMILRLEAVNKNASLLDWEIKTMNGGKRQYYRVFQKSHKITGLSELTIEFSRNS